MNESCLFYYDTDEPVLVGDRIQFRKLFGKVEGEVVYIPGQTEINRVFGNELWAIQLDNEPNDVRSMPYFPSFEKYASKKILLLSRGKSTKEILPEEEIL